MTYARQSRTIYTQATGKARRRRGPARVAPRDAPTLRRLMARKKQRPRSAVRTARPVEAPTTAGQAGRPQGHAKGADDFSHSSLRTTIAWVVVLKIVGIVLLIDPAGLVVVDLPKSLFSRATEWLLIGLLFLVIVRFGPRALPRSRLSLPVAGLLLLTGLSAVFADNAYVALYGEGDRYLGLTFLGDMAVTYVAIVVTFRTNKEFAMLSAGLAAALLGTAGYAFLQVAGRDPLRWTNTERPFGTMGNPDF